MKITEADKEEAMKTKFLMTLGQMRYYNTVNNRPKLKKQEDKVIMTPAEFCELAKENEPDILERLEILRFNNKMKKLSENM